MRAATIVAIGLGLGLAGCGNDASARDARESVESFYAAIEAKDGAAACEQLSEDALSALETAAKKPCEDAVLSLELPPSEVATESVWVTSAQVSLQSGDTAFLDQIGGDWKIAAAGCHPLPGQPHDCELEG